MKNKGKRPRKFSVKVEDGSAHVHWNDASITIREFTGNGSWKEVTIKIARPLDVDYIREQLDKVVAGWQKDLELVTSSKDSKP